MVALCVCVMIFSQMQTAFNEVEMTETQRTLLNIGTGLAMIITIGFQLFKVLGNILSEETQKKIIKKFKRLLLGKEDELIDALEEGSEYLPDSSAEKSLVRLKKTEIDMDIEEYKKRCRQRL